MVPDSEHGGANHLPVGLLRVPGGEKVVGAVLQAALARHHRHLSQGDEGIILLNLKQGEFEIFRFKFRKKACIQAHIIQNKTADKEVIYVSTS